MKIKNNESLVHVLRFTWDVSEIVVKLYVITAN